MSTVEGSSALFVVYLGCNERETRSLLDQRAVNEGLDSSALVGTLMTSAAKERNSSSLQPLSLMHEAWQATVHLGRV